MHKIASDVRSLSSGTMSALMREIGNDAIDTSHYASIDRMHHAFVAFTDSMIATAAKTRLPFPYQAWQDLWAPFQQTRFFYDGLGTPAPTDEERRDQAEALGFDSVAAMDDHQHWLDQQALIRQAIHVVVANAEETGIIDMTDATFPTP